LKLDYLCDFEDGTLQSWYTRGGEDQKRATLSVDTVQHHGGAASLKVSGRTWTWNGPMRPLSNSVQPGATYHVSG
jgi:endo-1,4-beta-xylanase